MKLSYSTKNILKWLGILIISFFVLDFLFSGKIFDIFGNSGWTGFLYFFGIIFLLKLIPVISSQLGKWVRGTEAETDVEIASYDLPKEFKIITNLVIGKIGNVDQIIVGPNGIWVVEVKSHSGKITFDGKRLERDGRSLEKSFLNQVWDEVKAVRAVLKNDLEKSFFVYPVLCFSEARVHFGLEPVKGVYIVGKSWLTKLIMKEHKQKLSVSEIEKIIRVLEKYKE